jgi:hypothetical protein
LKTTNERLSAAREGIKNAGVGTEVVIDDAVTTLGIGYPWSSLAWSGPGLAEDGPHANRPGGPPGTRRALP